MTDSLIVEVSAENVIVGDIVAGSHFGTAKTADLMQIDQVQNEGQQICFISGRSFFKAVPNQQIAVHRVVHAPGDPIDDRAPSSWPAGMTYDHKGTAELLLRSTEGRHDERAQIDIARAHVHAILATIPVPPQIYMDIQEPS